MACVEQGETEQHVLTALKVLLVSGLLITGLAYFIDAPSPGGSRGSSTASSPTAMTGCRYEYGNVSADHLTPDGKPVLFQLYDCGSGGLTKRYLDFQGRAVSERELIDDPYQKLHDALEDASGMDLDRSELEQLEQQARARGLIR
jgi:hypothetical protein